MTALGKSTISEFARAQYLQSDGHTASLTCHHFRTIAALGSAVNTFKIGERVAGFHETDTPNGTYAEYAICPEQTAFRIPDTMSDEEAATIPLAIFTAAVGLYRNLGMPAPWDRSDEKAASTEKVPLVVNAASGAVGAFAISLPN